MFKALKKKLKDQRGLTLIELLAVIVILGIIAAIAIPSIGNVIQDSREKAIKAEALQILDAARLYSLENTIPDAGIDNEDLEPKFIDSTDNFTTYTVKYVGDEFILDGDGSKGESITIEFNDASKEEINLDEGSGDRAIPAAPVNSVPDSDQN